MKSLIKSLMLSCKKASEMIERRAMFKLSLKERLMLLIHTSMCEGCKAYQKQSTFLDDALKKHVQENETDLPEIKNKALKEKIISKL